MHDLFAIDTFTVFEDFLDPPLQKQDDPVAEVYDLGQLGREHDDGVPPLRKALMMA